MKGIGLDIGSRTVKLVVCENGVIKMTRKEANTHDPLSLCRDMLCGIEADRIIATGYGRHLLGGYLPCETVSEIKAFARGSQAIHKPCSTVLDIGGQDTKAISLDDKGKIARFQMNDKCAAGTGRFLEVMATALGLSLEDFIEAAASAETAEPVNSMCAVFAESEVISMIARGSSRAGIALGIHQAVARRAVSLLEKVSVREDILFAGGVALNPCMRTQIEEQLGRLVIVPQDPQIVGALGCALMASEE
ncbi:MAG: R-phenyllactate dehydratase activator [Syntrophaceae bacterium PtaB.Bin038]|jgi:predicted CoA-substrate-specific enzyme activase|nr:MAG: R-phenyllactate dehydratase activator [Syntrophaceae bacterium PtaB.Bin038]